MAELAHEKSQAKAFAITADQCFRLPKAPEALRTADRSPEPVYGPNVNPLPVPESG